LLLQTLVRKDLNLKRSVPTALLTRA
jgi:hypothetical protein